MLYESTKQFNGTDELFRSESTKREYYMIMQLQKHLINHDLEYVPDVSGYKKYDGWMVQRGTTITNFIPNKGLNVQLKSSKRIARYTTQFSFHCSNGKVAGQKHSTKRMHSSCAP
jgi:hypothetical protein